MNRPFYTEFAWAYDLLIEGPVASRVSFITEQLKRRGILEGARLLDAGCGTGTYSVALAERGFAVTGLDAKSAMIAEAKKKIGPESDICFLVGDILHLPATLHVDAILCRGVLNDLTDDDSRRCVFGSFAGATRDGGVLILDVREWNSTVARKTATPVFEKTVQSEKGQLTFRSFTVLQPENHSLLVNESHILRSGGVQQVADYAFVMRCWTQDELTGSLKAAGFDSVECFGDYDPRTPVGATDRLVAVATMGRGRQTRPNQASHATSEPAPGAASSAREG